MLLRPLSLISAVSLLTVLSGAAHAESYSLESRETVIADESGTSREQTLSLEGDMLDALPLALEGDVSVTTDTRLAELNDLFERIRQILDELESDDAQEEEEDDGDEPEDDEDEDDLDEDDDEDEDDLDEDDDDEEIDDDDEEAEEEEDAYDAYIDAAQEVPPVTSTGSGVGEFSLRGNDLHYTLSVEGLTSPVTAAHFHHAPRGQTGAVVEPIQTVSGSTVFSASGTWLDLTDQEMEWLEDEHIYVNVHTQRYPAGEVRGQVED